jgi:hypothetical protein
MRRLAIEKGGAGTNPIVISTCRKEEQMCTLYAPLVQTKNFLMGRLDSESYKKGLPEEAFFISYGAVKQGLFKITPAWAREYVEMLP